MTYAGGRYWLTYNGEIYNFVELRETLSQLGHRFLSDSDSEVILAAYSQWGPDCQLRFNGMWAFAIWDAEAKELFLSRDRFGIKPLYYAEIGGCFTFSSELKAFLVLPWCTGEVNEEYLTFSITDINGQEAPSETLLAGVKRLHPGHCMRVTQGRVQISRWWNTLEHIPEMPKRLDDQVQQFRELFLDACRLRLRSDVSIATSLSGGLDSSAVACAISDLGRRGEIDHVPDDWHRAFVACFPGTRLDERGYAEEVVAHTGMRPEYCLVDDADALQDIEKVIFDLEGIWFTPLVGPWTVYRAMRHAGISVSLDGHGADELLGGYHFYVEHAIMSQFGREFHLARYRDLRRVQAGLVGGTMTAGSGEKLQGSSFATDVRAAFRRHLRRFYPSRSGILRAFGLPPSGPEANRFQLDPSPSPPRHASALFRMQFISFHSHLLPTFLRCIDRASMSHGVEVRMPFLDWRLVTFGFGLPDESRIGDGYTKRILRLAMRGLMPESIRLRTNKFHFSSPISEWARGALRPWLLDLSASRSFLEAPIWNGAAARRALESAVAGTTEIGAVWPLVNAHVLRQCFRNAAQKEAARQVA